MDQPINTKYIGSNNPYSPDEQHNQRVIERKGGASTYNKHLLSPSNIPIPDEYDITNLSYNTIKIKQRDDPL